MREATVYHVGIDVPVDARRALELYRGLCNRGDQDACADLGWFLTEPGPQHDERAGLDLLAKTCDGGGARACYLLALADTNDPGFKGSPEHRRLEARAAKLFRRDCEAGKYNACDDVEVEGPDAKATLALLEKRCKDGAAAACGELGSLHVFGLTDDSGATLVPQDTRKAIELLELSCTRVARGCRFLAELYASNDPREQQIRRIACDAWDPTSCTRIGNHARACDLGHATACRTIGREVR